MRLEYSVKRKYTVPHLTAYFSGVSAVVIVALAVLNVILQGYDVVTVLRSNPNTTDPYWWSTSVGSLRSAGKCNPVSLPRKSAISTNSSLFSYELRSTFDSHQQNIEGATAYTANPLRSCTVDSIVANLDLSRWSFKIDVPILCTGSELPYSLSLMSTFSLNGGNVYYDDIISHYIQNRPPHEGLEEKERLIQRDASSQLNVIAAIDAINSDLQAALDVLKATSTGNAPVYISTGGIPTCPGGPNAVCLPEEMRMRVPECGISYANGSSDGYEGICPFLAPIETDLLNPFVVLQDAYHIDFGNIRPSNTLLSMEAFSSRIKPSVVLSRALQNQPGLRICTWGLGCMRGSTWTSQLLASNPDISVVIPSILPTGNTSAVAKFDYLCPEFRLKRLGSLLTSVFIGTWSMYMALVGIFGVFGPMLEKRYGRVRTVFGTNSKFSTKPSVLHHSYKNCRSCCGLGGEITKRINVFESWANSFLCAQICMPKPVMHHAPETYYFAEYECASCYNPIRRYMPTVCPLRPLFGTQPYSLKEPTAPHRCLHGSEKAVDKSYVLQ